MCIGRHVLVYHLFVIIVTLSRPVTHNTTLDRSVMTGRKLYPGDMIALSPGKLLFTDGEHLLALDGNREMGYTWCRKIDEDPVGLVVGVVVYHDTLRVLVGGEIFKLWMSSFDTFFWRVP